LRFGGFGACLLCIGWRNDGRRCDQCGENADAGHKHHQNPHVGSQLTTLITMEREYGPIASVIQRERDENVTAG
jgi:hypothetical protein